MSAAAQLAVLPITLTHFNQLSTIGLVANLGVVPLAGAATIVGLVAVGLSFLSQTLAAVAFDAVWPVLLALRGVVALAAGVPGAVVHLPAPGWIAVTCYVGGLALLVAWHETRVRDGRPAQGKDGHSATPARGGRGSLLLAVALLALAVGCAAWPLVRPPDGRLRLTILDVGQGDAIVVELPDGRALLVDAGSGGPARLDAGERVVAPFLWNRGILRLAAVAVTHDDSDHAGGAPAIRRLFSIDEQWTGASLPVEPRRFGRVLVIPLPPLAAAGGRRNEAGLVLRIEMGLASFLLASDIGVARERQLVPPRAPSSSARSVRRSRRSRSGRATPTDIPIRACSPASARPARRSTGPTVTARSSSRPTAARSRSRAGPRDASTASASTPKRSARIDGHGPHQ